jgi:hypothetical protein
MEEGATRVVGAALMATITVDSDTTTAPIYYLLS